jgi:hypothetical protein
MTRRTLPALVLPALLLVTLLTVTACGAGTSPATRPSGSSATSPARPAWDVPASTDVPAADDPNTLAGPVRTYARAAGIHPQLLMAILYNEAYKPHDPDFQRNWLKLDPDASLGVANMHRAAFDDTKRGRDFAHRRWEDLIDDRALGVEAAAWYLHDLSARLPRHRSGTLTEDELIALGYNAGPGNMLAFARGVHPGPQAQEYLAKLHRNWQPAAAALAAGQ